LRSDYSSRGEPKAETPLDVEEIAPDTKCQCPILCLLTTASDILGGGGFAYEWPNHSYADRAPDFSLVYSGGDDRNRHWRFFVRYDRRRFHRTVSEPLYRSRRGICKWRAKCKWQRFKYDRLSRSGVTSRSTVRGVSDRAD